MSIAQLHVSTIKAVNSSQIMSLPPMATLGLDWNDESK